MIAFIIGIISCFSLILFSCTERSNSGEKLYKTHCGNCHMANGKGVGTLIPSLIESKAFKNNHEEIACWIRNGILAKNKETAVSEQYTMPPNQKLSEIEITNILNYIQQVWHQDAKPFTLKNIQNSLIECN